MPPDIVPAESSSGASPEQRFLQYARTGDKAIIQALVMEFADQSYSQARRIVGRDDGAEDAIQEAYLRLVSTAGRYDGSIPFAAWLGRLVSSAAINFRREKMRRIRLSDPSEQGASAMINHGTEPSTEEAPEIEALRTALDSLPDHYRMPLTLHYFGGLNRTETAQALGASAGTIGSRLFRGLELLRDKLARSGITVTSAGLIAAFAALPTYAASAEIKASLVSNLQSSERLLAATQGIGYRLAESKAAALLQTIGFLKAAAVVALIAGAALLLPRMLTRAAGDRSLDQTQKTQAAPLTPDPRSGLIAHWAFDEGSGQTVHDSSGNGNLGMLVNNPAWVSGKTGGALSFDGIDDFVEIPGSTSLNSLKGRMTVTAWVLKKSNSPQWATIVARRLGPDYWDLWEMIYFDDSAKDAYGFTVYTGKRHALKGPSSARDVNKWIHLAGVYDGSELRFYRDGILEGSVACTGTIPDETSPITIGGGDNGDLGPGDFSDAIIDDVRIYNRALSAGEVAALAR